MICRVGCAACCVVISISSPMPGYPKGKRAGERCIQLTPDNHCSLFGKPGRPQVCIDFRADPAYCGETDAEAYSILARVEALTAPGDQG